jgi:hypothetical protein
MKLRRVVVAAILAGYAIVAAATSQVSADRTIIQIGACGNVGYVYFAPTIPTTALAAYAARLPRGREAMSVRSR